MKLKICPTCGCSLVRLGIKSTPRLSIKYKDQDYFFCCEGCIEQFQNNEEKYIAEIKNLIICPVCLAEKPENQVVSILYNERHFLFCRCPQCVLEFNKNPGYFIDRLNEKIPYKGVFEISCCNDSVKK